MPRPPRRLLAPAALLAVGLAAGCATQESTFELAREGLRQELVDRGLDPTRVILPFGLTEEMREWARKGVPDTLTHEKKLEILRDRLLDPDQMRLEYEWGYTGTAIEVFERRRANCLAFTNLFIAMAREIGVPVYFLAVDDRESFRRDGDLIIVSDHIAVGYGAPSERKVLDFAENPTDDYRLVRKVPDITAVGMFHSNRGAEALQAADARGAVEWLSTAVAIDPELAHAWLNLGVALRRMNQHEAAEAAYERAIEVDPQVYSAYQNLITLLRHDGREDEAREYEVALAARPNRNPFSYLALGDLSVRRGDLLQAERFYRRCANLSAGAADCHAALGHLKVQAGDRKAARRLLDRARQIDDANPRAVELARLLDG